MVGSRRGRKQEREMVVDSTVGASPRKRSTNWRSRDSGGRKRGEKEQDDHDDSVSC